MKFICNNCKNHLSDVVGNPYVKIYLTGGLDAAETSEELIFDNVWICKYCKALNVFINNEVKYLWILAK